MSGNSYITPLDSKSGFIFSPTFQFFSSFVKIVINSSRLAVNGKYDGKAWSDSSWDTINQLERVGVQFEVSGLDNLRESKRPVIFIANHMSTLETVCLPAIIQPIKEVVYVIKKELTKYPVFGNVIRARDPICVGRQNPREDLKIVLTEGAKKIADGKSIIIFPQKTRSKYFDTAKFNSLGVKLAQKNNINVIPVALLTDAWSNGKLVKDFGRIDPAKKVRIKFGQSLIVNSNTGKVTEEVISFIKNSLIEWGRENLVK